MEQVEGFLIYIRDAQGRQRFGIPDVSVPEVAHLHGERDETGTLSFSVALAEGDKLHFVIYKREPVAIEKGIRAFFRNAWRKLND